jgi:hypothetical protein
MPNPPIPVGASGLDDVDVGRDPRHAVPRDFPGNHREEGFHQERSDDARHELRRDVQPGVFRLDLVAEPEPKGHRRVHMRARNAHEGRHDDGHDHTARRTWLR